MKAQTTNGIEFDIDECDAHFITQGKWFGTKRSHGTYVVTLFPTRYLHRMIFITGSRRTTMGCDKCDRLSAELAAEKERAQEDLELLMKTAQERDSAMAEVKRLRAALAGPEENDGPPDEPKGK